jgi:preprotein translocase subunit SecA
VGIPHNVLNAKNHEREAEIIANAGQHAAVTIATNMAGRGTDIVLGPGVKDVGGLHVIGTERHESRRIDNQLRGRAGRQGDPGSSRFYLSLEDDLMRIFAGDRIVKIMDKLGMEEDVPISDRLITRTILNAQSKVEAHHFDQREHLLKYDDVLNKQREVIYSMRRLVLEGRETRTLVEDLSGELATDVVSQFTSKESQDNWDWPGLRDAVRSTFAYDLGDDPRAFFEKNLKSGFTPIEMQTLLVSTAKKSYADKVTATGDERMADIERYFFIQSIDYHWKDHLLSLDHLKEGIHLRGYAQKDPLVEYRREGFALFKMLDKTIRQNALTRLYTFRLMSPEEEEARKREDMMRRRDMEQKMSFSGPDEADGEHVAASAPNGAPSGTQAPGEPAQPTREQQIATNPGLAAAMNFLKQREAATKGSPSGSPKK